MITPCPTVFRRIAIAGAVAALAPSAALAVVPDAGSQIRRLQQETRERLRPRADADASVPAAGSAGAATEASGPRSHVAAFAVHGVTRLGADEVREALAPFTGRALAAGELQAATEALARRYRESGWFAARVFVPPQPLGEVVRLDVYEGVLEPGGLYVKNDSKRVRTEAVQSVLEAAIPTGAPMHRDAFERGLLLAEDLPGVRVKGTLYPGEQVGGARLRVRVTDEAAFAGNVDADNFGNAVVGRERIGTTLYWNDPSGAGDQAVARLVTAGSKSNYGYLTYLRPVTATGARFGASADHYRYRSNHFAELGRTEGEASDVRLYATYPVIRSRHHNVRVRADAFSLRLVDRNETGIDGDRRVSGAVLGVSGDRDHDWLGDGASFYEAVFAAGRVSLRGNEAYRLADRAGAGTEGGFARLAFTASRLQHLSGPWSVFGRVSGQVASGNLDSSQKFYLGGVASQPGLPLGEIGADQGIEIHAEWRRDFVPAWGGALQASTFAQKGWVKQHKAPWDGWQGARTDVGNSIDVATVGLAAVQTWKNAWVVRGVLGRQAGGNPLRNPVTGLDSDGKGRRYRAWFQLIHYF